MQIVAWLKKDEQVADALRTMIASGEWTGTLPGYRKLEQRLQVSRPTIEKAFDRLTAEGWLGPAVAGKRRQILRADLAAPAVQRRRLLLVGPRPLLELSGVPRQILFETMLKAEADGWEVSFEHFDFGFRKRAVSRLEQLVDEFRASKVLLIFPNDALVAWTTQSKVPCFSLSEDIDANWQGSQGISVPYSQLVCEAAELLRAQGHWRILIPLLSGKVLLRNNVMEASAAGWAKDYARTDLELMFPEQGEWLPGVMKGFWRKPFAVLKPTAVIVKGTNDFLSLLSFCNQAGIRIPYDLSVIQLSSDPISEWLDPVPDRFEFPVEKICRKILQWLDSTATTRGGFETLSAAYHRGGTVAPLRKS